MEVAASIASETKRGARKAIKALETYGELGRNTAAGILAANYTQEQILGDWFPPEPAREGE